MGDLSHEKKEKPIIGIIRLVVVLAAFVGVVLLVLHFSIVPKDPASAEKVWDILVSQGFQPYDVTDQNSTLDPEKEKCIAIQKDDIHFEFYVFSNENRATNAYSKFYNNIILNKNEFAKVEHKTQLANYTIYTLKVSGTYNVAIYVENTAVYAYCNEENSNEIGDILKEIGYFEK